MSPVKLIIAVSVALLVLAGTDGSNANPVTTAGESTTNGHHHHDHTLSPTTAAVGSPLVSVFSNDHHTAQNHTDDGVTTTGIVLLEGHSVGGNGTKTGEMNSTEQHLLTDGAGHDGSEKTTAKEPTTTTAQTSKATTAKLHSETTTTPHELVVSDDDYFLNPEKDKTTAPPTKTQISTTTAKHHHDGESTSTTAGNKTTEPLHKPTETIGDSDNGRFNYWRKIPTQLGDTGLFDFAVLLIGGLFCVTIIYLVYVYRTQIAARFRRCCLSSDWRQIARPNFTYESLGGVGGSSGSNSNNQGTELDQLPLTRDMDDGDEEEDDFFGALNARTPLTQTGAASSNTGGSTSNTSRQNKQTVNSVKNYVY